jgi:hypothetical protein
MRPERTIAAVTWSTRNAITVAVGAGLRPGHEGDQAGFNQWALDDQRPLGAAA